MEDTSSRSRNGEIDGRIIAVAKKHWTAYIFNIVGILIGLSTLLLFPVGIIVLFITFTSFMSNLRTKWILTDEELIIKSGFLPWKQTYFEIPKEKFYESYYTKSFFSVIFGYGNLVLRRTDGTTSNITSNLMTNHEQITSLINSITKERLSDKTSNSSTNSHFSTGDELTKLAKLKEKGLISKEEFDAQKNKILNS